MDKSNLVLLVEDDLIDQMTVKRCMKELDVKNPIQICENGEVALEYLKNKENQKPAFILLDLNMPRMNGLEFLKVVKADNDLKKIPVIVLTTSKEDQDRLSSFDQSVAGYMIKPVDYSQFVDTMRVITAYWNQSELSS